MRCSQPDLLQAILSSRLFRRGRTIYTAALLLLVSPDAPWTDYCQCSMQRRDWYTSVVSTYDRISPLLRDWLH